MVETLSPTGIDATGFTAHGRHNIEYAIDGVAFDWATSSSLLPGIENEVETGAHHIKAAEYHAVGDWWYFSKRIESGGGTVYYRALWYSDGM